MSFLLLALSFIINNNELYPIVITLCISNLIAKILILKNYKIKNKYDFIFHYFTAIISIILLIRNEKYNYKYRHLVKLLVFYLMVYILYKVIFGKFIYKS